MTSEAKKTLRKFLRNPNCRNVRIDMPIGDMYFSKQAYDDETEFIHVMSCNSPDNAFYINTPLDFAGVYSIPHDHVICATDFFKQWVDDAESEEEFEDRIEQRMSEVISQMVHGEHVPVTKYAFDICNRKPKIMQEHAHEKALGCYLHDCRPGEFEPEIFRSGWVTASSIVRALNHPDVYIQEYAERYVLLNANKINDKLDELKLIRKEYEKLLAEKGFHYYHMRISEAVRAKVSSAVVDLEFEHDGELISCAYSAPWLCVSDNVGYPTEFLSGKDKQTYMERFNRGYRIIPSDIRRIIHDGEIIYDRDDETCGL